MQPRSGSTVVTPHVPENEAQVGRERLRNHEPKEFKGRRGARAAQKLMGPVWNRRPALREGGPGPRVEDWLRTSLRRTRGHEASHVGQRSGGGRAHEREREREREKERKRERERGGGEIGGKREAGEVCVSPVGQSNSGGNVGCLQGVTTGSDWGDM